MTNHQDNAGNGNYEADFKTLYGQMIKAKTEWQNTFDSISDMICILDRNSKIVRVNKSFQNRFNIPFESIIGSHCYEVVHKSLAPIDLCPLNTVLETGRPAQCDTEIQMGESQFALMIYPFFDSSGKMLGTIHFYRDVTEQKALKDRLIQSEKMAAIGTLAAEIAHEINNPLDYISNYLYLLSESLPEDFPKRPYLSKIEAGIDNLAALTRDLLEFSRPRPDVFTLIDMHSVIDTAFEFASKNIVGKKVEIIKNRCSGRPLIMGDARLLQQVLINLINNSLDAMPNGGSISVTTAVENGRIDLEFADTGTGIPEAHLPRIFDPLFTTKKSSEKRGTGLGLTICYNIIKQHSGDMEVTSRVGEGTRFRIILPGVQ